MQHSKLKRASGAASTLRLLSISDAAAYCACNERTIRRRISEGRLTGYRMGPRLLRVDLNELDALLRPIPTAAGGGRNA